MTYPIVEAISSGSDASAVTSRALPLPTGALAGDLVIFFIGGSFLPDTPSGWSIATVASGAVRLTWIYRVLDGSEGSSVTLTNASSARSAWVGYRISHHRITPGANILTSSTVAGVSSAPNPPSVSVGSEKPVLSIAAVMWAGASANWSAYSSGYSDNQRVVDLDAASTGAVAVATRNVLAASENPGAATLTASTEWATLTMLLVGPPERSWGYVLD